MGSQTPKYKLPYPVLGDTPDVPRDVKALADAVEREMTASRATTAARALGTAAAGTSDKLAREDHVHPSSTAQSFVANGMGTSTTVAPSQAAVKKAIDDLTAVVNNKVAAGHTHTAYALTSHTHSYAATTHTHSYAATTHTHSYAATTHTHTPAQVGVSARKSGSYTLAGSADGTYTIAHGLGKLPTAVVVCASDDNGAHSITVSTRSWDATNVVVACKNLNNSTAETFTLSLIAVG